MQEDVTKLLINILVNEDVYKVLICLQRIDNFQPDKDLRSKYALLKGIKTTDFGIDPYLNMSDPIIVVKEVSKKYGIDIETTRDSL